MTLSTFQIVRLEDEEKLWWELWDRRRRRMAVAQAVCYAAYTVCILRASYQLQGNDSVLLKKERKRKVRQWERKRGSLKKVFNGVAEAIKEANCVVERSQPRVYTEREVYAELVKIGVERQLRYSAYSFLTRDPVRVSFFRFSC